jgi:hypothetical protein
VQASKLELSHGRGAGSSVSISTTTTTTVSASGTVANAGKTSEDPAGGVAPPPSIPPLNFNSQLSMTDLVEEQCACLLACLDAWLALTLNACLVLPASLLTSLPACLGNLPACLYACMSLACCLPVQSPRTKLSLMTGC